MRITRIYQDTALTTGAVIDLDERGHNHLIRVLRLKVGAEFRLFNGLGGEYHGVITTIAKKSCQVTIGSFLDSITESPLKIHLGQGLARGEKMDFIIQKAVELGITEITPLFTRFCDVQLDVARIESRMKHWQQVIIHACEQSGRDRLPRLNPPTPCIPWLQERTELLRLSLHPQTPHSIENLNNVKPNTAAILIGPEGGLSDEELSAATSQQFILTTLGPRILRTETAALAMIAILQSRWGDLAGG